MSHAVLLAPLVLLLALLGFRSAWRWGALQPLRRLRDERSVPAMSRC